MSTYRPRGKGRGVSWNYRHPQPGPNIPSPKPTTRMVSHPNSTCCSPIQLILDLDPASEIFSQELKTMWNLLKKSPPVLAKLHQYFNVCINPYEQTLRLMFNCQDFSNAKTKTLPFFIIEELKAWLLQNRHKTQLLSPMLKIDAFKVITLQNVLSLTKLVVEVFEMDRDPDLFLPLIRCMLEKKKYKEACQGTMFFKLQDKFSAQDFLLPMVLQDKLSGVDDFLVTSKRHQLELVTLLDGALGRTSVREALSAHALNLEVPDIKWDKLHAKPLKKFVTRLAKTFRLPADATPNLNRRRNEGALQFLLHKRYVDNSFGDDSWREMAQEAVGSDFELQKELMIQVCIYGDVAEALRWAHFYKIDKQHWPYNVRMLEENPDEARLHHRNVLPDDDWYEEEVQSVDSVEYHKFPLPFDTIHLVDSEESFRSFLSTGLQGVELVGIDCEWKPNFGGEQNGLALMQIATRHNIFIVDIVGVGNHSHHLWQELGRLLFNNCDILKLGFGFSSDMVMIKHTLPGLNFTKQGGVLDLLSLWKVLEKYPQVAFPFNVQNAGPSLCALVNKCLGRPLDKSDQFSNWEKRPLRSGQLVYAALDAYCLIQVYDVLKQASEKVGYPFEETCYNLITNEKMPKRKPKKPLKKPQAPQEEIPQPPSPHVGPVPPSSVKVVCDTMLQGLGKNLRRCGIDTAILDNNMDHMECVRYAQDENRYVLTRGHVFNKLYGYVPLGHCLKMISDNVDEQLKEFLDYYKVGVTKEYVFSVCQACNSKSFVQVSRSTMVVMRHSALKYVPESDDLEEATGFSSDEDIDIAPGPHVPSSRKWDLFSDEKVDVGLCQTRLGAKIKVEVIPDTILSKMDSFYVCEECGKVYWDGTHLDRILAGRLQGIVQ